MSLSKTKRVQTPRAQVCQIKAIKPLDAQLSFLSPSSSGTIEPENHKRHNGFFKLPLEIRLRIYSLILRPEVRLYATWLFQSNEYRVYEPEKPRWYDATYRSDFPTDPRHHERPNRPQNFLGCTKILSLCRQTYLEAIEFLHLQDVRVDINDKGGDVFRPLDAFGMPGFFVGEKKTTRVFTYPRFCELQFLRLRHIELRVDTELGPNFKRQLRCVAKALRNSADVESLKVNLEMVKPTQGYYVSPYFTTETFGLFNDVIDVARVKQIQIFFSSPDRFKAGAPLDVERARVEEVLPLGFNPTTVSLVKRRQYRIDYQMVPECRHCLQIFSCQAALRIHLRREPGHIQRFRKREYNAIVPYATQTGDRKCPTCAKEYSSVSKLEEHMRDESHRRYGVVPRWKEDNEKWDRYWKWHLDKFGWL
ncbi:uncharacterized protein AB675_7639 [Cyphellophora attinorum]|uniref:C2H2-type domain-containing protein n=1 Tax=Cyphellophora attinorum TaxID=1664694 RepID=A0A0N0NMT0_9EURO|nr:uncharacterized protein AB675_7639 [Phialophora attinorum]KPI40569.1 hypothetical protein AB675_7639 [Phialophora attinorum]